MTDDRREKRKKRKEDRIARRFRKAALFFEPRVQTDATNIALAYHDPSNGLDRRAALIKLHRRTTLTTLANFAYWGLPPSMAGAAFYNSSQSAYALVPLACIAALFYKPFWFGFRRIRAYKAALRDQFLQRLEERYGPQPTAEEVYEALGRQWADDSRTDYAPGPS